MIPAYVDCVDDKQQLPRRSDLLHLLWLYPLLQPAIDLFTARSNRATDRSPLYKRFCSIGSSRECVHGLRERQVSHAVVEVADVVLWSAESIHLMADYLCLVVEALHSTVTDGHVEVVQ